MLCLFLGACLSGCAWVATQHCEGVMASSDPARMEKCVGKRVATYDGWIAWVGDTITGVLSAITAFFS